MSTMTEKFQKLKRLLMELFQLDQPDLDFGIYRIMHAKSDEITQFLEKDLLPQVREAFEQYRPADREALRQELEAAVEQAKGLGADPDELPKVRELRERYETHAVDIGALENEVYDRLYSFFRRYYSEGDFLSKRVYKPGVYAIPYEGEEVKLHWANADQYYIKTSEYLRDYAFRLKPDDEADPMRVHFRLVDAAEGEHGNVKAVEGRERVFILAAGDFMSEEDGEEGKELAVRFEYRPATLTDWPEDSRDGKSKPPVQKDLIASAASRILAAGDGDLKSWSDELGKTHILASGEKADYTRLEAHLKRYVARNTFDYFIHKDLGGFLRRELDFYIKNEVMHLDDVEDETAPRLEQYLSKIKVIRKIAHKIIDFLAQIEDFQKKLWLKKKLVVETNYCISMGSIPEEFYPEIAANDAQQQEWGQLLAIDGSDGDQTIRCPSTPLSVEFLGANPTLIVDTRHFPRDFANRVLEQMADLDWDGVLFHGENFQALVLMRERCREQVKCIYIDPPFNSPSSEIVYKNDYRHSSFLSLMQDRLMAAMPLSTADGTCVVAIDENEGNTLLRLIHELYPSHDVVNVTVEHNKRGIQGDHFSYSNEFAIFILPASLKSLNRIQLSPEEWGYGNLRNWGGESLRTDAANCFYPIYLKDNEVVGFGEVCPDEFHPAAANVQADNGLIAVYPVDSGGVERKWRYARNTVEGIRHLLKVEPNREGVLQIMKADGTAQFKTVWSDPRYSAGDYGTKTLTNLGFATGAFNFPKSIHTVRDSIYAVSSAGDTVLDYFAGSGTSGHAVINLNREDGGHRKFVLVDNADYFDSVLLPRIKKVTFTPEWKGGKPERLATEEEAERSPRIIKYIRLESYEDALNNLEMRRTESQQALLESPEAQGADGLKEQYLLRYTLDVDTRGSQSLLNIEAFSDPTAYKLKVKRPGSDESREMVVDLLETFNWLIGLTVQHIAAPHSFIAEFERDGEKRLRLQDRVKMDEGGPWWFRTVTGTSPDGRRTLVIWRKRPGGETPEGIEQDNLVLDEWFTRQGYSSKDSEFDLIYVNGDNNLENLKAPDDTWKVRLIEEDFHRLMFDTEGV